MSPAVALVAALLFAVSATLQQTAAREAALQRAAQQQSAPRKASWLPVLGLFGSLVRNPPWVSGWILNVAGFVVHAIALHLGSITVVQAVLVAQLLFALLLAATLRRRRLVARDWWGTVAVCAGVVLLIVLRGAVAQVAPPGQRVIQAAGLAVVLIVVMLVAARLVGERAQLRSALVAVCAGVCFCATAVFVVVLTDDLARGGVIATLSWPLPCLVVSAVVGSVLVQDSFASGSLPTALTTMTITDPVASCLAGLVLFDAIGVPGLGGLAGLSASAVLIAAGVVILANSPTLREDPGDGNRGDGQRAARTEPSATVYSSSRRATVADHG